MRSLCLSLKIIFCLLITFCSLMVCLPAFSQNKDGASPSTKLSISEQKNITITGNIKQFAKNEGLLDQYAFQYIDLITGKDVIIPISKDSVGNFSVTFPVNGYQEIQLTQGVKMGDDIRFDMIFVERFFAKPGDVMKFDFRGMEDHTSKSAFKGNMANTNNQQDKYYNSLREALGSVDLVSFDSVDSLKAGDYVSFKQLLTAQLKKVLDFNTKYFSASNADPFLKTQLDLDSKYLAGSHLLIALLRTKEKDPNLFQFLDSIGAPLNNQKAYGNSRYKYFLNSYYDFLVRETFATEREVAIQFPEMARYLLKEHIEFSEDEKELCRKMLDTVNKASKTDKQHFMDTYFMKFDQEYLTTFKVKATFDLIASNKDRFVKDVFLTRLLRERLDKNQLVNINSLISDYKSLVRDNPLKKLFLKDFQLAYDRLYKSKLSSRSVLNDAQKLPPNAVVKTILEKYKGKVIYLDVWATWCAPCISEMANSKKLRNQFINKDVVFLYLCISSPTESTWQNLIAGHDIEGEHYFLSNAQSTELGREFNIRTIPRYLIIDKDGSVANAEAAYPASTKTLAEIGRLLLK